ncbi:MAG: cysteine desulfurase family protein [Acidimicrobiaceae bacterium]|nr:cysteine desulfurase family protein [Acidimicrobiaceae bacterium]
MIDESAVNGGAVTDDSAVVDEDAVREVYLDYNASAPLDERVLQEMLPMMSGAVGNASSVHRFGRRQAAAVDDAREHVAALVGGRPAGVVFTSGATEANNLALQGIAAAVEAQAPRLLVSAVEHASVSRTARRLADRGSVKLDVIPVASEGFVEPTEVAEMLGGDVAAVSVMAANSETGVLNPVAEIAELAHAAGALFHCDATQMAGRLPFDMQALGADLVSLSGHKICGPTGVGALVGARGSLRRLEALIHGGGHERGLRSGSLNVAGIVGLGVAARIAADERAEESATVAALRDRLVSELRACLPAVQQNGDPARRLPNTANLRFVGADAEAVMSGMDPVAVSIGSACSAGSIEPSEVLVAMGLSHEAAFESVRFSLGRFTTGADIDIAVRATVAAVERVRAMNA